MKLSLITTFILYTTISFSQNLEKVMVSTEDPYHFYLNDGDATDLFYYKMVPKEKPVGVLTIFPSGGESIEGLLDQITLHQKAYENNFLVIIPSYNWGTITREPDILFVDSIFQQVIEQHHVSKDNFFLCGLSNGGMISLNYGIAATRDSNTVIIPKGIIGLDPPLDLAHFYNYCEREIARNFSEAGVNEAKWLKGVYEQVFGGSPKEVPQNYIEMSMFSYGEPNGGNAKYLNNIAIRMHSDLNIDYLLSERHRDLYDWNGTDIVAFVNQLKLNGNKNANVIITQNKGVRPNGKKHPHSWSIMDTDDTMNWVLETLKRQN